MSQAIDLGCTAKQYDTPLAALVAPNGYKGTRPTSTSVEHNGTLVSVSRVDRLDHFAYSSSRVNRLVESLAYAA